MASSQRSAFFVLVAALLLGSTGVASAQCPPGMRCRGVEVIGPRGGGARVVVQYGRPTPPVVYVAPPPPRPVYVQPAPVYVQPPAPQVVYAPPPPQPQVVIVRPSNPPPPPQVVYVQPQQPQTVYVRPAPQQTVIVRNQGYAQRERGRKGLHFSLGGAGGNGAGLGGFNAAFRVRPSPHFALDFGIGIWGGHSVAYSLNDAGYYTSNVERVEIPLTVDALVFVNPQHKVQVYFVGGPGLSFATVRDSRADIYEQSYTYFGGSLGGGLEFRLSRGFALNVEARGFLRGRIDSSEAEFVRPSADGGRSMTNTSGGFIGTAGLTAYF